VDPEILPPDPRRHDGGGDGTPEYGRSEPGQAEYVEVGEFRQGSPGSQWALSRYLVGRAIGEDAARILFAVCLLLIALAVLVFVLGPTWIGVLLVLAALGVFAVGSLVRAVLRRVSGAGTLGLAEPAMRALVRDTRLDVRRELRRIGLPSHVWSLPLLAARLAGRRRAQTTQRLRDFDVDRVVPAGRLDELHLLLDRQSPGH
jgi:hypothetical protein